VNYRGDLKSLYGMPCGYNAVVCYSKHEVLFKLGQRLSTAHGTAGQCCLCDCGECILPMRRLIDVPARTALLLDNKRPVCGPVRETAASYHGSHTRPFCSKCSTLRLRFFTKSLITLSRAASSEFSPNLTDLRPVWHAASAILRLLPCDLIQSFKLACFSRSCLRTWILQRG
jgi:hypothetical protein